MTMPSDEIEPPYFDASSLPDPSYEYVCWFDIMGTQGWLLRSINHAANHIFKLHGAVAKNHSYEDVEVYPAMDGVYLTTKNRANLIKLLEDSFAALAQDAINRVSEDEGNVFYTQLVRGAISYGPIIHGKDIDTEALEYSLDDGSVVDANNIVLGDPVSQVFSREDRAPPYGLFIDESARAFPEDHSEHKPFDRIWLDWFHPKYGDNDYRETAKALNLVLHKYFVWCKKNSGRISYKEDKMEKHFKMTNQYFPSWED